MPPDGPLAPVAPPPSGVVPAIPGPIVSGSPVPSEQKGPAIIKTGYASVPKVANVTELLKTGASRVKVVAVVGASNLVTDQEVVEAMRQRLSEFQGLEGSARITKEKEVYATELRKTIERELILDEMYSKLKKAGKMQVIEEIKDFASQLADRQLREIRKFYGLQSEDEFNMVLRMQGLTMPVIRRQIERQVMADQYIGSLLREKGRRVGLSEIHAYYDAHPNEFQSPDRVKWQHLFVSFTKHPTPQAAYNHAESICQKAASGADFVALVKQYDDGFAGKQNGFGTGEKRNEIQPLDLEPAVWALKADQMSAVIQTPTGYHIVKVIERDYAGPRPFDAKVQDEIREKLTKKRRETEYKRLVEELWRKGVVRVFESEQ